jgi:hypothetical protein
VIHELTAQIHQLRAEAAPGNVRHLPLHYGKLD